MGSDSMAVVDHRPSVHGMEGRRVIDASIMLTLIAGHNNAPAMMIAEKGAEMIPATLHAAPQDAHARAAQH